LLQKTINIFHIAQGRQVLSNKEVLELSYNNAYEFIRGDTDRGIDALSAYRFDPKTQQFRSRTTGNALIREQIRRLAASPGSREIGAGVNTIKRALLTSYFRGDESTGRGDLIGFLAKYTNEPIHKQLM
jgi:hypothetical protein